MVGPILAIEIRSQSIEHGPLTLAGLNFTCDVAALYRTTHLGVA